MDSHLGCCGTGFEGPLLCIHIERQWRIAIYGWDCAGTQVLRSPICPVMSRDRSLLCSRKWKCVSFNEHDWSRDAAQKED